MASPIPDTTLDAILAMQITIGWAGEGRFLCVKVGGLWQVYSSAILRVNEEAWQIKDQVPYGLGSFAD